MPIVNHKLKHITALLNRVYPNVSRRLLEDLLEFAVVETVTEAHRGLPGDLLYLLVLNHPVTVTSCDEGEIMGDDAANSAPVFHRGIYARADLPDDGDILIKRAGPNDAEIFCLRELHIPAAEACPAFRRGMGEDVDHVLELIWLSKSPSVSTPIEVLARYLAESIAAATQAWAQATLLGGLEQLKAARADCTERAGYAVVYALSQEDDIDPAFHQQFNQLVHVCLPGDAHPHARVNQLLKIPLSRTVDVGSKPLFSSYTPTYITDRHDQRVLPLVTSEVYNLDTADDSMYRHLRDMTLLVPLRFLSQVEVL